MMINEETDIVRRCKEGDKNAFRWVVQTYQRMLFSLGVKMLADEEEAKDAVQETFIRAWQHIGRYDERRPLSTWLYTIATRLCLDRIRRRRFITYLPGDEDAIRRFASDSDIHRELECGEWVKIVRVMSEGMSEKQRLVFTLCQLEGLSSDEVEQITGLDARQVKSNLYVARQTVRKRLKCLGYEED